MGGRSSSSSASTTNNQDNRIAVQDGIGLSASSGNSISITDGGLVSRGLDTVDLGLVVAADTIQSALDSVQINNATNADSFSRLLSAADSLWSRGENLIGQTQKAVADAYSQAEADKSGTIDNRTIIVLAVATAATMAIISNKGRA
jgi:hypothetical protein